MSPGDLWRAGQRGLLLGSRAAGSANLAAGGVLLLCPRRSYLCSRAPSGLQISHRRLKRKRPRCPLPGVPAAQPQRRPGEAGLLRIGPGLEQKVMVCPHGLAGWALSAKAICIGPFVLCPGSFCQHHRAIGEELNPQFLFLPLVATLCKGAFPEPLGAAWQSPTNKAANNTTCAA